MAKPRRAYEDHNYARDRIGDIRVLTDDEIYNAYAAVAEAASRHGWTLAEARQMLVLMGIDGPEHAARAKRALRARQRARKCLAGPDTLGEAS